MRKRFLQTFSPDQIFENRNYGSIIRNGSKEKVISSSYFCPQKLQKT